MDEDENHDGLSEALRSLPAPGLDPSLAARVLALARTHLEPAAAEASARRRLTLAGAMVPALLGTVVMDHVAETVKAVDVVYGHHGAHRPEGRRRR